MYHIYRARGAVASWAQTEPSTAPPPVGGPAKWSVVSHNRIIYWPGTVPSATPPPVDPPNTAAATWQVIGRSSRRMFSWQSSEAAASAVLLRFVNASSGGSPQATVAGLRWAFFDRTDFPALLAAGPVDTGTTTTDVGGSFSVSLPNSALAAGDEGWLIVTNSDGTSTQSPPSVAFCAPVRVQ